MLKQSASRERDSPVSPLCSRNARPQKGLVGRAQRGTHPGHPRTTLTRKLGKTISLLLAALLDSHFEYPENFQASTAKWKFQQYFMYQSSFSAVW
jgi:hypothetical protein